jgi:chromosome segregation ATPase
VLEVRGEFLARIIRTKGSLGDSGGSSSGEKKFRLSLQNMERRFVDLEVAISEIVNRLNALGDMEGGGDSAAVEDLMQRVDELEDLIAVEQAGIAELKDILTRIDKGFEHRFDTASIEEKIKEVENVVHIITKRLEKYSQQPAKTDKDVVGRVDTLEAEIGRLKKDIESSMEQMMTQKEAKKEGVKGAEFEGVAHMEIGQMKQSLRDLDKKLEERIEVLKKELQERTVLQAPAAATAPPKQLEDALRKYEDEVKKYKKDIEDTNRKMEGLSESMRKLTSHLDKVQSQARSGPDVDVNAFKKELDSMKREYDSLRNELKNELKNSVNREDMENMMKSLSSGNPDIGKAFEGMKDEMKEAAKRIETETEKRVSDRMNNFSKRFNEYNERMKRIDEFNKRFGEFSKRLDQTMDKQKKLEERVGNIGESPDIEKNVKKLEQQIDFLRQEVDNVRKVLIKMDERHSKKVKEKEPKHDAEKEMMAFIKGFGKRMGHLEKNLAKVMETVSDLTQEVEKESMSAQDGYFQQITDKLVFLESRLAAIESLLQKPQPIVIE